MIYFVIYLCINIIWAVYTSYRQRIDYKKPFNCWKNVIITGLINLLIFPYSLYIAIKNKKI
jgi:hypothetical protein